MTVVCKVDKCPFRTTNGFCKNQLVSINTIGQCGWIFDSHGTVKWGWDQMPEYQKEKEVNELDSKDRIM